MEGCYEVYLGNAAVGKVQILPEGLYLRITCRCAAPQDQIYRLCAEIGDRRESIGVVVPEGDGLRLTKRIPAKRFGGQTPRFYLSTGGSPGVGVFVPICPEEPFAYIDRLQNAFLESRQGRVGICIEMDPEKI